MCGWAAAVRRSASPSVAAPTAAGVVSRATVLPSICVSSASSVRLASQPDDTGAAERALSARGSRRPASRPMSFVRPITNSMITSTKPTTLARSMIAKGIAFPRTFSASAQKMWPPSSGRNGNRLMIASDSEISARISSARSSVEADRLARDLVGADEAADLLALSRLEEVREDRQGALRDDPHARHARAGRRDRSELACVGHVREAEPGASDPSRRVVLRSDREREPLPVAYDDDACCRRGRAAVGRGAGAPVARDLSRHRRHVASDAVDRDESVARLQVARGRLLQALRADDLRRGRLAVGEEQRPQDHERDQQVDRRTRCDHDDPLPHGLSVVGAHRHVVRRTPPAGSCR